MLLFYVVRGKVNVCPDHIKRSMSEYLLKLEYPGAVLNAHLSKGMSERMRTATYILYTRLLSVIIYPRLAPGA